MSLRPRQSRKYFHGSEPQAFDFQFTSVDTFQSVHAVLEDLMDKVVLSKKLQSSINTGVFAEYCI